MVEGQTDGGETQLRNDPLLTKIPEIEGYKVLEPCVLYAKVGEGGMGAVYRGRHLNLDIDVAIKCLKNVLAEQSPTFVTRFQREARIAASVHHQNLVQVYDISEKNGVHYLVMEYVRGETARERVTRKKKLKESEALKILLGAASGLAEAHGQKIVHRDIKPDNILISHDGKVKVSDLGLAKALEVDAGPSLTMGIMGTPQYMAPEQWEDSATVGAAADVWALGATFYYLLTGDHAISGGSMQQIYRRISVDPFPDIQQRVPTISVAAKAILERCIQKDPKKRFADCRELVRELSKIVVKDAAGPSLNDAESGTMRVPPLLSPPPAETLGHIRVALQEVGEKTLRLGMPTPPGRAQAAAPGSSASSAPVQKGRKPLLALAVAAPVLVLAWFVIDRMSRGGETVLARGEESRGASSESSASPSRVSEQGPPSAQPSPVVAVVSPPAMTGLDETQGSRTADEQPKNDAPSSSPSLLPGEDRDGTGAAQVEQDLGRETGGDPTPPVPPEPERPALLAPELVWNAPATEGRVYTNGSEVRISGTVLNRQSGVVIIEDELANTLDEAQIVDGAFELVVGDLAEGEHELEVAIEDLRAPIRVICDRSPPVIHPPELPGVVRQLTLDLPLRVEEGHPRTVVVTCASDGTATGEWQAEPGESEQLWVARVSLVEGSNALTATATDQAGNQSSLPFSIEVDSIAPAAPSASPSEDVQLIPRHTEFTLSFSEGDLTVELDGRSPLFTDESGVARFSVEVPAGSGRFALKGKALDAAGNELPLELAWDVQDEPSHPENWTCDTAAGHDENYWALRAQDPRTGIWFRLLPGQESPVYMAETEVTCGQWNKGEIPRVKSAFLPGDDYPITWVSWKEANKFCLKFDYELPSPELWRTACRAGSTGPYSCALKQLRNYAWFYPQKVSPAGKLAPNAHGLFDMHGNVWEWCSEVNNALGGSFYCYDKYLSVEAEPKTQREGVEDIGFRPVHRERSREPR